MVAWIEACIGSLFARTTIKLISEAEDWKPLGASLTGMHFLTGCALAGLLSHSRFPVRRFMEYSIPLFWYGMSIQIFDKVDLFALSILGGTAASAGIYGAARNLSIVPLSILVISFSPLLLSTMNRLLVDKNDRSAKDLGFLAMHAVIALLPFAAMQPGPHRKSRF